MPILETKLIQSDSSETLNILLENELYLSFLTNQVKGIFNHFHCNHLSLLDYSSDVLSDVLSAVLSTSSASCTDCTKDFIKCSEFKEYFIILYDWFKQENFQNNNNNIDFSDSGLFYPTDIINCFKSIHNHLKDNNSCSYFCSSWLDGIYQVFNNVGNYISVLTIFESLCMQGDFETLKWFYKSVEKQIILQKCDQERIFINTCYQKKPTILLILSWLLSLEIFNHDNLYFTTNEAFRNACKDNNLDMITFLLTLEGKLKIRSLTVGRSLINLCNNDVYDDKQLIIGRILLELNGDQKIFSDVTLYALTNACEKGHIEMVRLLLSFHKYGVNDAFKMACKKGHVEIVRLLLSLEGDQRVNNHRVIENALSHASFLKHKNVIRLFLELKGDQRVNREITHGVVFTYSCSYGFLDLVKILLFDVEENIKVKQYSVIERGFNCACSDGQLEIVQLFLELSGNQKITQDTINKYAFLWACNNGHLEVVKLLLSLKGDQQVDNENIKKAFIEICQSTINNIHIVQLFLGLEGDRQVCKSLINNEFMRRVKWAESKELVALLELELEKNIIKML